MNPDRASNGPPFRDVSKEQTEIAKQLTQAIVTVRHIDELFQWVANAFVQHFDIQLMQFWTNQVNPEGQLTPQLRTIAHKDPTLPEQVAANTQMVSLVQYIMNARRSYRAQTVESLFPSFQTILLKRYGLFYCGACFTSKNIYLPPLERMFSYDQLPTPLTMIALFFVRQVSPVELLAAISITLEQALTSAENRSLLTSSNMPTPGYGPNMPTPGYGSNIPTPGYGSNMPTPGYGSNMPTPGGYGANTPTPGYGINMPPGYGTNTPTPGYGSNMPPPPITPPIQEVLPLEQLIPRRKQDAELMLSSNPFASKATISDKKARRLHGVIDGRTNVAGLCATAGMSLKEAHIALQLLLAQQYIEIYEPSGRLVKNFPFIKDM